MNKLKQFAPFFMLVFFVGIIGVSTYKINAKQHIKQEASSGNMQDVSFRFFVKTDIALPAFTLPDLYDEKGSFSNKDLKGHYSVINFFASWCTTCRAEHEYLMRLESEGIVDIYGIAWRDMNENTKAYLENSGNPYVKTASDNKALFSKITGIKAVPETLIVNPEGTVILRYQGNLDDFTMNEIRTYIAYVSSL